MRNAVVSILVIFGAMALSSPALSGDHPSYTFWYSTHPPVDLLSQFTRIIVESDNITDDEMDELKRHGGRIIAYLSVGELSKHVSGAERIRETAALGSNDAWGSMIMDLSSQEWQQFILHRAEYLSQRGVEGFFLDTLDSYMLLGLSPEDIKAQQEGLEHIIKRLKKIYPDFTLVANRGFEIIDRVAPQIDAVAVESLYRGWDNTLQRYQVVSDADRNWLLPILKDIRDSYNMDIVVLDYLSPEQREEARNVAKRIENHGFIPWIANPAFDYMGVGNIEAVPRKILLLFDSTGETPFLNEANIHRLGSLPFEYMGYIPEPIDVQQGLPKGILKGRYSGIVVWFVAPYDSRVLTTWLTQQIEDDVPVAFLGNLDLLKDKGLANLLGLQLKQDLDVKTLSLLKQNKLFGFSGDLPGRVDHVVPLLATNRKNNQSQFRVQDANGLQADLVVTGDWGGFAASTAAVEEDLNLADSWSFDPFVFFQTALNLPSIPAPDITTENGRRLLFIHVNGDGFIEKFEGPGNEYSAEILLEKIFKKYPVPQTISIIEGEIGPTGLYPELSSRFAKVAREIFSLDNVEIASHSYSNPFDWRAGSKGFNFPISNLPLNNYTFSFDREIIGSANYINSYLAPAGKKTEVFLWTGNCRPTQDAVAITSRAGLLNINGGDTSIKNTVLSLTSTFGMGRSFANGEFQTYAAACNENAFTNNWTGPFYGYRDVIKTFILTDSPRRLKPINIHYHFYSGSKLASLKALQTVYDWAMTQETMPIYASDYVRKVLNYQTIGIARRSDGSWRISGMNDINTIRIHFENKWPEMSTSIGLAGWREIGSDIYLHADPSSVMEFKTGKENNPSMRLRQANGRLTKWIKHDDTVDFRIQGHVPVQMELANALKSCKVLWRGGELFPEKAMKGKATFTFSAKDTGDARIQCDG